MNNKINWFCKTFSSKNADGLISKAIQYAEENDVEMLTDTKEIRTFFECCPYPLGICKQSYIVTFKEKTNNMEHITINGKEYTIDIEKCLEQGLLKEENKYPKDWKDFVTNYSKFKLQPNGSSHMTGLEVTSFEALGRLIVLRDWWWNNMCDGWRPVFGDLFFITHDIDKSGENEVGLFNYSVGKGFRERPAILVFPTKEIRDKFFKTYEDLIEEAKMFL